MAEPVSMSVEAEIAEVEAQIREAKKQLAALKEKRRLLYARQTDRDREAMAKAATDMGLDYDAFLSQINRYKK